MWYGLRSPSDESDSMVSATELLHSTARRLIYTVGGLYLAWHIVVTATWARSIDLRFWLVLGCILSSSVIALHLLPHRFFLAQVIWQFGLIVAITVGVYVFQRVEIVGLYALLPLISFSVLGWPAGIAAELIVAGLLTRVSVSPHMPFLPVYYALGTAFGGAVAGVVGWSSSRNFYVSFEWYFSSFIQAQKNMESARQHRAQLARVMKDLDRAYYRLQRTNAALVAARHEAEQAERSKAEFVTNVSHELRTPLNLVVGFSEIMMTSPESYGGVQLPGPYRGDLNTIYASAQHLLALADDVIDMARIDVGKVPLVQGNVDLASVVTEATDMLQDYIRAKGLELRVRVPADLPLLWLDRLRIREVLLNLMVNAARFTEKGMVAVEVSLLDREVMVRVRDTGRGIPQQDLASVFETFRASDNLDVNWHSGAGLGLPISKRFIELHGGQMGVESTCLQGTTFWFTLPITRDDLVQPSLATIERVQHSRPVRSLDPTIVVIHDEPGAASLLQRYLRGYHVIAVSDPTEAARMAMESEALAVVTENVVALPSTLSVPLVIRCPLPSTQRTAAALGAADLLMKPVTCEQLMSAVERVRQGAQRVLIVDDDPEIVRLFGRCLRTRASELECLVAYNGQEALEVMRQNKPGLVFLDLKMPVLGGKGVLRMMESTPELAGIPVVLVSAGDQEQVDDVLLGAIEVAKPEGFQLGEMVQTLAAVLNALGPGWQPQDPSGRLPAAGPAA